MTRWVSNLPFQTDAGLGARARIGMVVLANDYTIEHEFAEVASGLRGVALYASRIPMSPVVTPDSLAAMQADITASSELILAGDRVDVVAYGCSSATAVLGEDVVFDLVRRGKPGAQVTTPITAAKAAMSAFGARRIAVLTPYTRDVNESILSAFTAAGLDVPVFGSFDEPHDAVVASITEDSMINSACDLVSGEAIDAIFISCTSLRGLHVAPRLEAELGIPVTASNHAMLWHALRLARVSDAIDGFGQLYKLPA
ncbi:MAG: Asp/Glu racemase [Pseudomonadota bacterium]